MEDTRVVIKRRWVDMTIKGCQESIHMINMLHSLMISEFNYGYPGMRFKSLWLTRDTYITKSLKGSKHSEDAVKCTIEERNPRTQNAPKLWNVLQEAWYTLSKTHFPETHGIHSLPFF
ncbi:hypothetical protein NPIL_194181 [Nephila pilipes]|uniref:Uncharacterized protein n=1 Tax=Nephila pilipes TaxID=299642 RepID=A0A8X6MT24_NEPPI|nr:hypothetical protein NPIL_194181 [Nephila pilipes]